MPSDFLVIFPSLLKKALLLFNRLYWFAKTVLKSSAFSQKFVINLFSRKRGGIQRLVLLFTSIFKKDQYLFELVAGLTDLLDNLE